MVIPTPPTPGSGADFPLPPEPTPSPSNNALLQELVVALRLLNLNAQISNNALKKLAGVALNWEGWVPVVLQVITAGTPIQGPHLAIPVGVALRVRVPPQSGAVTGYVSNTRGGVLSAYRRITITEGGDPLSLSIDNMSKIWVDADTDGTVIELIAEQDAAQRVI